ncbi:GNAT family N-acetyltransferase [Planotetraspora phitsanulokensis]|uniref:N-acetyltransferase n=1 Tax=Planotetraspora phitsanulokensis TaxID=575192 RepID=A0A8J3URC1_9ACTN|nr:GNAT family N-acetyltransferase [Planotetraspora phitsanulokensis]GII43230.1 N-acetyltransferase [Planotetraspora phitsanulokensis]
MIRAAAVSDAPAIGRLKVRAWRSAYAGFMPEAFLDALDPAEDAAGWAEYLANMPQEHRLWVAEHAETVIGFCRTGPADDDTDLGAHAAEVYGLYIEPDLIGTGLGRELFTHALTDLEARGHDPLCVYAYTSNTTALRFYEKAGFIKDGVTRLDAEDGTGVPEARLVRHVREQRISF